MRQVIEGLIGVMPFSQRTVEEEIRFVQSACPGVVALSCEYPCQDSAGISHVFLVAQLLVCRQSFLQQGTCFAVRASCPGEAAQGTERSRYAQPVFHFPEHRQALSQQHLCPIIVILQECQCSSPGKGLCPHLCGNAFASHQGLLQKGTPFGEISSYFPELQQGDTQAYRLLCTGPGML